VFSRALAGPKHNVVKRQNSEQRAFTIDNGYAPDLLYSHGLENAVNIVIGCASEKLRKGVLLGKHHILDEYVGGLLVPSAECDADIAVGDHADDVVTLTNYGQEPAAVLTH